MSWCLDSRSKNSRRYHLLPCDYSDCCLYIVWQSVVDWKMGQLSMRPWSSVSLKSSALVLARRNSTSDTSYRFFGVQLKESDIDEPQTTQKTLFTRVGCFKVELDGNKTASKILTIQQVIIRQSASKSDSNSDRKCINHWKIHSALMIDLVLIWTMRLVQSYETNNRWWNSSSCQQ